MLLGYLIGHADSVTRTVTIHDGVSAAAPMLFCVRVAPEQSPTSLMLDRDAAVRFEQGLFVAAGEGVDVHVWAVGR